jgi:hypothetical protein
VGETVKERTVVVPGRAPDGKGPCTEVMSWDGVHAGRWTKGLGERS